MPRMPMLDARYDRAFVGGSNVSLSTTDKTFSRVVFAVATVQLVSWRSSSVHVSVVILETASLDTARVDK